MSEILNYAPSCERNRTPILNAIKPWLATRDTVLELGSYSGQHAQHFSLSLPHLTWQPSDQRHYLEGLCKNLSLWQQQNMLGNCLAPLLLDVAESNYWPSQTYDVLFTANTLHIMSWSHVEQLFQNLSQCSALGTLLIVYGPFNYFGEFTCDSNQAFDRWLKERDCLSGIRDFESVNQLAMAQGFQLQQDNTMPANNRLIIWQKME